MPDDDAYLRNGRRYNSSVLRIWQTSVTRTTYIKFDVSSADLNGKIVTSATLRLKNKDTFNRKGTWRLSLGAHSNWNETNLSTSNAPAPTTLIGILKGTIVAKSVVDMDVFPVIRGSGTYTLVFQPETGQGLKFSSKEGHTPPELILTLR